MKYRPPSKIVDTTDNSIWYKSHIEDFRISDIKKVYYTNLKGTKLAFNLNKFTKSLEAANFRLLNDAERILYNEG